MNEKELVKKYEKFGKYLNIDTIRHAVILEFASNKVAIPSYGEIDSYLDTLGVKLNKKDIYEYIDNNINISNENDALSYNFEKSIRDSLKNKASARLYYYNKYIKILREKIIGILNALNIVDKVCEENILSDYEQASFDNLDFEINSKGVLIEDAMRLVRALVYDVLLITDINRKANKYSTYMSMKEIDVHNNDIYPNSSLVLDSIYDEADRTSIVLSDRKKEEREKEDLEYLNKTYKVLEKAKFYNEVK